MIVLSKGWKLPETGDFGDVWFPALEDNIQQENSHNHDGVNSELISSLSISSTSATIASGDFTDQGNGYFRATVTTPGGTLLTNTTPNFKDPTTLDAIYLKIELITPTSFYVYTNFVQNFLVYYGI